MLHYDAPLSLCGWMTGEERVREEKRGNEEKGKETRRAGRRGEYEGQGGEEVISST